jgi:hypothetical protein
MKEPDIKMWFDADGSICIIPKNQDASKKFADFIYKSFIALAEAAGKRKKEKGKKCLPKKKRNCSR